MSKTKSIAWVEVKADYLSYMGLDEISRKYNVSINTLKSKIRRGNWKQERDFLNEEVKRRILDEMVAEGKKLLLKAQEEWHQASLKMYEELVDKVKHCNDVDKLNLLLSQFMAFCKMNELIYQPENPEAVFIFQ